MQQATDLVPGLKSHMDVDHHNIKNMEVSPGAESMEESLYQTRGLTKLPAGGGGRCPKDDRATGACQVKWAKNSRWRVLCV